MSKKYLVIGSGSAIGKAIIARLQEEGDEVFSVSRRDQTEMLAGIRHLITMDITLEEDLPGDFLHKKINMLLKNISYNDKEVRSDTNRLVGKPYPLLERIRMGGIGSPRYIIHQASPSIMALLNLDHNTNYCNIELRPGGIIVGFRSLLETYGWIVPYARLGVFRSLGVITLYSGEHFMRLLSMDKSKSHGAFIRRLIHLKAEASRDLLPSSKANESWEYSKKRRKPII